MFFLNDQTFVATGIRIGCDRHTVALWYYRYQKCTKSFAGIKRALADKPRSGRPPKIKREHLDEARKWCEGRPFTPAELCDKLEELSGVRLSIQQVRRYARRWGHRRKKTQSIMINRASVAAVRAWRSRLYKKIARYQKKGYAVATMDESHFLDSVLSAKFWTAIGVRIIMLWGGGHQRFSMFCTMTMDGRPFFNDCSKVNESSFLEHLERVYKEVGKMVLVLDKAPWHTSKNAKAFFKKHDIVVIWYPTGHPYLNPVEEVWSVLKRSIDSSIRYADKISHLDAVYKFINNDHEFDYDFIKFWNRKPPQGAMRPFIRTDPGSRIEGYSVD